MKSALLALQCPVESQNPLWQSGPVVQVAQLGAPGLQLQVPPPSPVEQTRPEGQLALELQAWVQVCEVVSQFWLKQSALELQAPQASTGQVQCPPAQVAPPQSATVEHVSSHSEVDGLQYPLAQSLF